MKNGYSKKQIKKGASIFVIGLIFFFIILYYKIFIPYHIGEFDSVDLLGWVLMIVIYIFSFLAIWKREVNLVRLGFGLAFFILFISQNLIFNHEISNEDYDVDRDKVTISNGYLYGSMLQGVEDYSSMNISLEEIIRRGHSNIALEDKDKMVKSKNTGLYYKGWSLKPFTGVYLSLNQDESFIKKAIYFKEGIKDKIEKFIDDNKIEKIEYYKNGQIQSIAIHKNYKLYGEYKKYYANGQLEHKVLPYKGELIAELDWESNNGGYRIEVVEVEHGKSIYYHKNGEFNVELTYEDGILQPRKYYNDKGELTGEWRDISLPKNNEYQGKEEKYRIIKGISYEEGKIVRIRKELLYRPAEWDDYHSQHNQGYYFEYDSDWKDIDSREYSDRKSYGKRGLWVEISGGQPVEKEFYPIDGKNMTYVGKKKNGNNIGIWRYYYPDGLLAGVEKYSKQGILRQGEYIWPHQASIKVIANEKGGAQKAIIRFDKRYDRETNPTIYDLIDK